MAWFMGAAMPSQFYDESVSRDIGGTAHKELTFQGLLVLPSRWGGRRICLD